MDPPPFSPLEAEFYLDPDDPLDAHRSVAGPLDAEYSLATKLNPLRIPLEDILQATNDFSKENLLRQDEKIAIYKGWLWWREVDVVIRKYTRYPSEFFRKIEGISRLKHRNVASLIGFCIEENVLMVVMERAVNGSLAKYINDQATLTWSQRLNICFGAALALTFRQHSSRHFYINMGDFEIMLDKDWEAKVLFCIESESKNSDLYSLGVILLEMLYGRKATIEDVNQYCYEEVDDMIDPHLRTQMHPHSLSIFSRTTYDCLKSKKRSDISPIAETLKEAFDIQWKHENRFSEHEFGFSIKALPEKRKFLEAVMKAGPLLQNLLLAGPLPHWCHPPPPLDAYRIPPPPVVHQLCYRLTVWLGNLAGKVVFLKAVILILIVDIDVGEWWLEVVVGD
ncbi:probable receptor-like protein kinase At2g23200 [Helianthus annuus]|uniref:probable receptor-like protein kinase At2g23200 n=1 Tax=Helianthus annuus TaxID=4232 RepID=UPI0016531657|nr:probable receptor-like protein kinase At2g23200 [Helianthus annuus]